MHHPANDHPTDYNRVGLRYRVLEAWCVLRGKTSLSDMLQLGMDAGQYTAWTLFQQYGVVINPYTNEVARPPQRSQQYGATS